MPGAHRADDSRFCGATTIVSGQSTVKVNGKLWAVEGDENTHGHGELIAIYGPKNVFIEGKNIICAVGDKASADDKNHPIPPTDPKGHSINVVAYGGAGATIQVPAWSDTVWSDSLSWDDTQDWMEA